MVNTLLTPSMLARYGILIVSRCIETDTHSLCDAPGSAQIAAVDLPFDAAAVTLPFDDYVDSLMMNPLQSMIDELLYARRIYRLPPSLGDGASASAIHYFNGFSMRCSTKYDARNDLCIARLEVAYDC